MNTSEQLEAFHGSDLNSMMNEAEDLGKVTQDWENEATKYDFPDGSILIICGTTVSTYGSR